MSNLTESTRATSAEKLRQAADLLEHGEEMAAGKILLDGLVPVARDLKVKYGPMVRLMVGAWVRKILDE
jgi:hypothetical protein